MRDQQALAHRGITIVESDHPSGARTWVHEESGSAGIAHTHEEAIRQISRFLGPDPACALCRGCGAAEYADGAFTDCYVCFPEDPAIEENRRVG